MNKTKNKYLSRFYNYIDLLIGDENQIDSLLNKIADKVLTYVDMKSDIAAVVSDSLLEVSNYLLPIQGVADEEELRGKLFEICCEIENIISSDDIDELGSHTDAEFEKLEEIDSSLFFASEIMCDRITGILDDNWPKLIQKRIEIENSYDVVHLNRFLLFRDFVILLKVLGVVVYTKDADGAGFDLFSVSFFDSSPGCQADSGWDDTSIICKKHEVALSEVRKLISDDSIFWLTNYNLEILEDPFYFELHGTRVSLGASECLKVVHVLAESVGIEVSAFADEKSFWIRFPGIAWIRKYPEFLYEIKNHS